MMPPDKLVRMANQIAAFFETQPGDDGSERVAEHLRSYWAPRMREQFLQIAEAGRRDLRPLAAAAAERLRAGA